MKKIRKFLGKSGLFFGLFFLMTACGSGGGEGIGGQFSESGNLYITDNLNDDYGQVIMTVYKVAFGRTGDQTRVTVFEDPKGVTYDIHELDGILTRLPNASIPTGRYDRVLITLGQEMILVDKAGTAIDPNPLLAQNGWTTCENGRCVIDISGSLEVIGNQRVILDFDLKNFTYDPGTHTVSAWIVLDDDGSEHSEYFDEKEDHYDLKGIVQEVQTDRLEISVLKAEHFFPGTHLITVAVDGLTRYTCDDDDELPTCNIFSLIDLQPGMRVEVYGSWDGSIFQANRVEVDHDMDIIASCNQTGRSIADYSGFSFEMEIEGPFSYSVDPADATLNVGGKEILLTDETRIKTETGEVESRICQGDIPTSALKIEVDFYQAKDASGENFFIAKEIELKV